MSNEQREEEAATTITGLVNSIRQNLAGAGADLSTLGLAILKDRKDSAGEAVERLTKHLESIDRKATAAFEAARKSVQDPSVRPPKGEAVKTTVFKYPLDLGEAMGNGKVRIAMPLGARVLHLAVQNDTPTLWAEVNPEAQMRERTYVVVGTGHTVPEKVGHVGSVQMHDADGKEYVWHIYEQFS